MPSTARNHDFKIARQAKKDEFYTSLSDIELELKHYAGHFKGKVVYCNCDDPRVSNFFRYFSANFKKLGLKKLITTCYRSQDAIHFSRNNSGQAVYLEYSGEKNGNRVPDAKEIGVQLLTGDGDFRSAESVKLLRQADIVVTNPPFSLFREYVAQLVKYKKKFVIIGNMNAVTCKEIFPLFQNNQMWYGPSIRSGDREFRVPCDYPITAAGSRADDFGNKYIRIKGVRWFTNLDYPGRHKKLNLQMTYCPDSYPTYENFDAIEVGKTKNIPFDYDGLMGVPITFLDKYSQDQFEIVMLANGNARSNVSFKTLTEVGYRPHSEDKGGVGIINGRRVYARILIRRKSS